MAKKYPKGMSEADKLALSQKRLKEQKAKGKKKLTPGQTRTKALVKHAETVKKHAPSGFSRLLGSLGIKSSEKPRRKKQYGTY